MKVPFLVFYRPDNVLTVKGRGLPRTLGGKAVWVWCSSWWWLSPKYVFGGLPQLATKVRVFPLAYTHVTFLLQFFKHSISSFCAPIFPFDFPSVSFSQSGQAEGVCPYMAWLHVWWQWALCRYSPPVLRPFQGAKAAFLNGPADRRG